MTSPFGGSLPLVFDLTGLGGLIGLLAVTLLTAAAMVTKFRRTTSPSNGPSSSGSRWPASPCQRLIGCLVEFVVFGKADWFSLLALLA